MRTPPLVTRIIFYFFISFAPVLVAKETLMVSMRDGVQLATDVYRPNDDQARPVILVRTPYNKNSDKLPDQYISLLNLKGLVYAVQDCRGRFASEGTDSVFITDGWGSLQDGFDTIDWLVAQHWCNGKVGMYGASASGITTYRAVGAAHPGLVGAVVAVAPSDFYHQIVFPGGEFRKSICENWINGQGSGYMIDYFLRLPWYNAFWEKMNLHTRADIIHTPVFHIGGWYDCFSEGPVAVFSDLSRQPQAGPQKLVVGPWTHGTTGSGNRVGELNYPDAEFDVVGTLLLWLDHWLTGAENGILNEPNVRYYLMGDPGKTDEMGCQWIEADSWPPDDAVPTNYFLRENSTLSLTEPTETGSASFSFDPDHPVPTLGGNNLTIPAGPFDQRALGNREDVLGFATPALTQPLRVEGFVQAKLFVSSNCPDTDFTLKLIDVYPDGREMLVTDGIARARFRNGEIAAEMNFLVPGEVAEILIKLPPTAIVFNSGHRMKVAISSGNFNRFEVNPNSDREFFDFSEKRIAENTVYFQPGYASQILVPVVNTSSGLSPLPTAGADFRLENNFPNPFNATTIISYELSKITRVNLAIYNQRGQRVRQLVHEMRARGSYQVTWNGQDENGAPVASGVYYCQLRTPEAVRTTKLIFLK